MTKDQRRDLLNDLGRAWGLVNATHRYVQNAIGCGIPEAERRAVDSLLGALENYLKLIEPVGKKEPLPRPVEPVDALNERMNVLLGRIEGCQFVRAENIHHPNTSFYPNNKK